MKALPVQFDGINPGPGEGDLRLPGREGAAPRLNADRRCLHPNEHCQVMARGRHGPPDHISLTERAGSSCRPDP